MEVKVLSYLLLSFLVLAGTAILRLHQSNALARLAEKQVLLFSLICTLFSAVLIVFWLYLFWLFVSVWYFMGIGLLAWVFTRSLKTIHYQSTIWALLLIGIIGALFMQIIYFADYYPMGTSSGV
jgi:hypothetical protein